MEIMLQKYLLILLMGLYMSSYSQDFIPENVLVYLHYSNNIRDKFLPDWQTAIKKNSVKKETYVSYDNNSLTDRIPIAFDSTVFYYDSTGRLTSSTHTSPFPGAEETARVTTNFIYEYGLFVGSKDDRGNFLEIKRDTKGRIITINYLEGEYKLLYKFNYTEEKLTKIELMFGEADAIQIVWDDGVFVAKDTNTTMSTIADKYGRTTNVYSHNIGMDNTYDSSGRLSEMKIYQGGITEITSFQYSGDLLQEIIYNNHEGEIGAALKDTKITKSVRTAVKYE